VNKVKKAGLHKRWIVSLYTEKELLH